MQRLKILILITTYNREKLYGELIEQIHANRYDYDIQAIVINDGSKYDVKPKSWIKYVLQPENKGKKGYWMTTRTLYRYAKQYEYDYLIQLPDDFKLIPDFFRTAIKTYESINDPNKVTLNLLHDNRMQCWTGFKRKPFDNVFKTQWVDMAYIAKPNYLKALNHDIRPIPLSRWHDRPLLGSGVGQQISHRLLKAGLNMYQVKKSLVIHEGDNSVMNEAARKKHPLK